MIPPGPGQGEGTVPGAFYTTSNAELRRRLHRCPLGCPKEGLSITRAPRLTSETGVAQCAVCGYATPILPLLEAVDRFNNRREEHHV